MNLRQIEETALSLLAEQIHSHKPFVFEVSSAYSMSPFLRIGDQISTVKSTLEDLSLGDILIFRTRDNFCVHRFLYKYKPKNRKNPRSHNSYLLITKGDNLINPDYPLTEDQIFGKAITIRRGIREIHLENALWRKINYIIGIIFLYQVYALKPYRFIKIFLEKGRKTHFIKLIKEPLSYLFLLPSRSILFVLNLFLSLKN